MVSRGDGATKPRVDRGEMAAASRHDHIPVNGLTLWLDEESYMDDTQVWKDKSPSKSDAIQNFFASSPTRTKRYHRSCLRFKAGDGLVGIKPIKVRSLVIVVRWASGPRSCDMLFAKYKNEDFSLRMGNGGRYRSHRADGNDWQQRKSEHIYVNGRQSCDALADQWTIVHAVKRDGRADEPFRYQLSSQFMNRYFKGEICEVLAYDRVLSGSEREHLEAHLSEKWNISLVHDHPGMGGGHGG